MKITYQLKFRDFKKAREFSRLLKFKNKKEWEDWCKSPNKPKDIPILPNVAYKNNGWKNYKDWLGC